MKRNAVGRSRRRSQCSSSRALAESLEPRVLLNRPEREVLTAADLGLSGEERLVAPGMWFLGRGLSPDELALRPRPGKALNVNAADTTNVEQLRAGGGLGLDLTGAGLRVGVWDVGWARETHDEFGSRVTIRDSGGPYDDHATHVAGTIGASGVVASAKGMAPDIDIYSYNMTNDFQEMRNDAGMLDLSNHSYSSVGNQTGWQFLNFGSGVEDVWFADRARFFPEDPIFGQYSTRSRDLDDVIFDNPRLLSVWAAGNDRDDEWVNRRGDFTYVAYFSTAPTGGFHLGSGWYRVNAFEYLPPGGDGNNGTGYDSIIPEQAAKNVLTVGAIGDITADPYSSGNVSMTAFSAWGPTDDGRVKPDVVGNGAGVFSPVAFDVDPVFGLPIASDSNYASLSGTSMSSPNVAGTAALLIEHYTDLYGAKPMAATTKALLIHTAHDAGNAGPDYRFGWGVVDGAAAAQFLTGSTVSTSASRLFADQAYGGSDWIYTLRSDGSSPLKATIAWTDPQGTASSSLDPTTRRLVNDLDLWVTGPGGTHWPWTLSRNSPSSPAVRTTRNTVDNVEQVVIDTPAAGDYTLHIGRPTGTTSFMQQFSLLVSGATEVPATAAVSGVVWLDVNGNGTREAGDNALGGRRVYADANGNAAYDAGEANVLTDGSGAYSLEGLLDGTHSIRLQPLDNSWLTTTPAGGVHSVIVSGGVNVTGKDFGAAQYASIAGVVFDDYNGDATKQSGEPGLSGRIIFLDLDGDNLLDMSEPSTLSDSVGAYSFASLAPASYRVRQFGPPGWIVVQFDRNLTSGLNLSGQNIGNFPVDYTGSAGNDTFTLGTLNAGVSVQIEYVPAVGPSVTHSISKSVLAGINVGLTVDAGAGDDTVVLNFAGGSPVPTNGLVVRGQGDAGPGGEAAAPGDELIINGSPAGDVVTVTDTVLMFNGQTSYSGFEQITVNTFGGNDVLNQNAQPTGALTFNAGASTTADLLNVNAGTYTFDADAATTTDALNVTVNTANVVFNATQHLNSLNLQNNAQATMSAHGSHMLRTRALTIGGTARLDLVDNDLILDYDDPSPIGTFTDGAYDGMTGLIASGRNGGAWNGTSGIITSTAEAQSGLTSIGIAEAGAVLGIGGSQTDVWNGQTVDATSVLVKYTYAGDANLDGVISGDDYSAIDFAFAIPGASGWSNGDFNYDGIISGDDYSIIDFNIVAQGEALGAAGEATGMAAAETRQRAGSVVMPGEEEEDAWRLGERGVIDEI